MNTTFPSKEDLYKTARLIETGEFVSLHGHKDGKFLVNGEWIAKEKLDSFCL